MYLEHYGFDELPFTLTPNTSYFFALEPHKEALQVALTALQQGEGIIKISGEVGTGKTLLCRKIMAEIAEQGTVLFFPNPYLSPAELRFELAQKLGVENAKVEDQLALSQDIHTRLLELNASGDKAILLIDEAQALPNETLEAIRLFGNLETETTKLLQIVLLAQPELDIRLSEPKLRQLRQRITFSYSLRPLKRNEVAAYIDHRLEVSGYKGAPIFSTGAITTLWRASRGVPRLINVLCHKALMLSYGKGLKLITNPQVRTAISDTEDVAKFRLIPVWVWFVLLLVIAELGVIAVWLGERLL